MMQQFVDKERRRKKYFYIGLFLVFFVVSILQVDMTFERLLSSIERGNFILRDLFPPVISDFPTIFQAAAESVQIAIIGTILGIFFSLVLAVLAARNTSPHSLISHIVKGIAAFERAVPALIWALIFIVAVGLGPTAGILAIAVNSLGMLVKIYSESIEEIDQGVIEAMKATGANRFQIIMQGIIPSVASIFISWSLFRFEINIRYSSVLGVVGAGGIGWELVRASRLMNYSEAMGITIIIFIIVLLSEALTEFLKDRLDVNSI